MEKRFFDFQLEPKKIMWVWFLLVALLIAPYLLMYVSYTAKDTSEYPIAREFYLILWTYGIAVAMGYAIFYFKIATLTINSVIFDGKQLNFEESFWNYLGFLMGGVFLSIITFGIYVPWFLANLLRFFTNSTRLENHYFSFNGSGKSLFKIFFLWVFLPVFISVSMLGTGMFMFMDLKNMQNNSQVIYAINLVFQCLMYFILLPFFYLSFKWRSKVTYAHYEMELQTKFWPSIGKLAKELLLVFLTVGIYFPLALVKVYAYFMNRTHLVEENSSLQFQYESIDKEDFIYIWGQFLLIIITVGFYYPWAFRNLGSYVLKKTSLTRILPEPTLELEPIQIDPQQA